MTHATTLDEVLTLRSENSAYRARLATAENEIKYLTDAIWEYGEHRKSCSIDSGRECDCGFFDIIKNLKE